MDLKQILMGKNLIVQGMIQAILSELYQLTIDVDLYLFDTDPDPGHVLWKNGSGSRRPKLCGSGFRYDIKSENFDSEFLSLQRFRLLWMFYKDNIVKH